MILQIIWKLPVQCSVFQCANVLVKWKTIASYVIVSYILVFLCYWNTSIKKCQNYNLYVLYHYTFLLCVLKATHFTVLFWRHKYCVFRLSLSVACTLDEEDVAPSAASAFDCTHAQSIFPTIPDKWHKLSRAASSWIETAGSWQDILWYGFLIPWILGFSSWW